MALIWTKEQGTGGNVNSFNFPSNVKAGSLLLACTAGDRAVTPSTPVDTLTNTWSLLGTVDDVTNSIRVTWWYAIANGAGANAITFTNMGSFDAYMIEEWSVSSGTILLDKKDTGNLRDHTNAANNIVSGTTLSTSVTDELVIGFNVEDGANVAITAGTGFVKGTETNLEGVAGNPVTLESLTKATPGTVTATFTGDASGRGAAFVATFRSTAATGVAARLLGTALHSDTDAASYTYPSATYQNNKLYICFVTSAIATGTAPTASITGGGITWVEIGTAGGVAYSGTGNAVRRVQAFRGLVTSGATTGSLTITMADAGSGATATGCHAAVVELDGADTSGTNGSGAIVQSPTNSGLAALTGSVTLSAFGNSLNRVLAYFAHRAAEATTEESGYSRIDDGTGAAPSQGSFTEFLPGATDTTPSATWSTSSDWGGFAIEIKAGSPAAPSPGHYRIAGPTQLGTTASTVFTAGSKTRIETISVSNPTGGAVTVTLSIGADAAGTRLLDAFSIPANRVWTQHVYIPIENTEVIQAKAGSAGALVLTLDGTVF